MIGFLGTLVPVGRAGKTPDQHHNRSWGSTAGPNVDTAEVFFTGDDDGAFGRGDRGGHHLAHLTRYNIRR
jgi:hypothetical protein